jgi:hypothetical protein
MRICSPLKFTGLAGEKIAVDAQKLSRDGVALVMRQEDAVALVLDGIASGDDVDEEAAVGNPVQCRRHARGDARRLQAGPDGHEIAQPLGERGNSGSDDPGILAASPGRQQYAVIAKLVGGLRDLAQIVKADFTPAGRGAEIAAITMGRQEPEDVRMRRRCHDQEPGLRCRSETVMVFGTRPSATKVSAMRCWVAITSLLIGRIP